MTMDELQARAKRMERERRADEEALWIRHILGIDEPESPRAYKEQLST